MSVALGASYFGVLLNEFPNRLIFESGSRPRDIVPRIDYVVFVLVYYALSNLDRCQSVLGGNGIEHHAGVVSKSQFDLGRDYLLELLDRSIQK